MKSNSTPLIISGSGAMTGTATITSQAIPLEQIFGFAIQAVWTGTPNGTLKLQVSCDPINSNAQSSGGPYVVTNWSDYQDSSEDVTGAAGNFIWNVSDVNYTFVRLVYTNSSSTGTLTAKISLKGM